MNKLFEVQPERGGMADQLALLTESGALIPKQAEPTQEPEVAHTEEKAKELYGGIVAETIKNIDNVRGGRGSMGKSSDIKTSIDAAHKVETRTDRDLASLRNDKEALLFTIADLKIKEKQVLENNRPSEAKALRREIDKEQKKINALNGILPERNQSKDEKTIQKIISDWHEGKRDWIKELALFQKAGKKLEKNPSDGRAQGDANRAREEMHETSGKLETVVREAEDLVTNAIPSSTEAEGVFYTHAQALVDEQTRTEKHQNSEHSTTGQTETNTTEDETLLTSDPDKNTVNESSPQPNKELALITIEETHPIPVLTKVLDETPVAFQEGQVGDLIKPETPIEKAAETAEEKKERILNAIYDKDKALISRAEKAGMSGKVLELLRDGGKAYTKLPLKTKLLVSVTLFGVAFAAGGTIASVAVGGSVIQRALGGMATFVAVEGVLKASAEKGGRERGRFEKGRHTVEALLAGFIVGGGALGLAIQNVFAEGVPSQEKTVSPTNSDEEKIAKLRTEILTSANNEKVLTLATIHKGDGIESVLIRQLMDKPSDFGFKGDINDASALKAWAGSTAHLTAGAYAETGVATSGIGNAAYVLEKDASGGLTVVEQLKGADGKFHIVEGGTETMNKYEYSRPSAQLNDVVAEASADELPREEYLAQQSSAETPAETPARTLSVKEFFDGPSKPVNFPATEGSAAWLAQMDKFANATLSQDMDKLFGSSKFFGFGHTSGVDSINWKDPQVGFGTKTVDEIMKAHPTAFPKDGGSTFGIENYHATNKMQEYIAVVKNVSKISPNANENVADFIRRAAIAIENIRISEAAEAAAPSVDSISTTPLSEKSIPTASVIEPSSSKVEIKNILTETDKGPGYVVEKTGVSAELTGTTGREFLSSNYTSNLKPSGAGFDFDKQMAMTESRSITSQLAVYNELMDAGKTEEAAKHLAALRTSVDMADKSLGVGVIDKSKIPELKLNPNDMDIPF